LTIFWIELKTILLIVKGADMEGELGKMLKKVETFMYIDNVLDRVKLEPRCCGISMKPGK